MQKIYDHALANTVENLFLGDMFSMLVVPERMSTREYAETYRWLTNDVTSKPGRMNCMETPHMLYVMECFDNPDIRIIVAKKSAQVAWSETQNSFIARIIDLDPQPIIAAFPREATAKSYSNEKIRPLIKSSDRLLAKIGNPDNCPFSFYKFPGGFLKLVTAGSPTALKSTAAPILIVEEPDDLKEDLKGQGDALAIFTERQKTFEERKLIYGGTPTDEGFSKVDIAYTQSNQMVYEVPCRKCGKLHQMVFKNLHCDKYSDGHIDQTYGTRNPFSAVYLCPFCETAWDDADKKWSIIEALNYNNLGWRATRESHIHGFHFNELMSLFAGSVLVELAKKKLEAEREAELGKEGKLKSFTNNSEGLAYAPRSANLDVATLKKMRISYEEKVVPAGGIILTMGVDVQHNRLAVIIRAWGRNGNSWLVWWGELYGFTKDIDDPVWKALTELYMGKFPHVLGTSDHPLNVPISACSIDSGDGNTTQVVYAWVKAMLPYKPHTHATKGSSDLGVHVKEIFTVPASPDNDTDKNKRKKLMESMGVSVFIVGVQQAKDEVLRKLSLTGSRDRSYHYASCRDDYEEQLLSNRKRLNSAGDATRYELVMGKRDEVLDCEVLALHSSRALHLHVWTEKHWQQAEAVLTRKPAPPSLGPVPENSNVTPGVN